MTGRQAHCIASPQVFCIDLDRKLSAADLEELVSQFQPMPPGWIIESSPNKYHLYWQADKSLPLDFWSSVQLGLAYKAKGDFNLANKTALIRVPGFVRLTKDGKTFLPHFVHNFSNSAAKNTIIRIGIDELKAWNWLPEAMEKGKTAAYEARRNASNLGRRAGEVAKGVGNRDELIAAAKLIGEGGRNSSLYAACRAEVWHTWSTANAADESKLNDAMSSLMELADEVNNSFTVPLSEAEVKEVVKSAVVRGIRALERKEKAEAEQLEALKAEAAAKRAEIPIAVSAETETETVEAAVEGKEAGKVNGKLHVSLDSCGLIPELETGVKTGVDSSYIPDCVLTAANDWVKELLGNEEELKRVVTLLGADMRDGDLKEVSDWVVAEFKRIGTYRLEAPVLFVRGINRQGQAIRYGKCLNKTHWECLVCSVISGIGLAAIGDKELKKLLKKRVKTTIARQIAGMSWAIAISSAQEKRQSADIIVFQNGVLELGRLRGAGGAGGAGRVSEDVVGAGAGAGGTGVPRSEGTGWGSSTARFVRDSAAPLKYSHPIWCYWDNEIAAAWDEVQLSDWVDGEKKVVEEYCPVFWRYMTDWFPNDWETVRILLCYFGYGMTTDYSRMKFVYFYGPTRSGKGSISRLFCGLVGDSNYSSSDYKALEGGFSAANMHDKLLISLEEAEGDWKDTERRMVRLKKYLGGEKLTIERKYCDPIEDFIIGKFILQSNDAPHYVDRGRAISERMLAFGFEHSFSGYSAGIVPPDTAIVRVEGDRVATVAALMWSKYREQVDCFRSDGSRAQEVGNSQVIESLDIVGTVLAKYVEADTNGYISSSGFMELVAHVADNKGVSVKESSNTGLITSILGVYPKAVSLKHLPRPRNNLRGFKGVKFKLERVKEDFPELIELVEQLELDSGRSGIGLNVTASAYEFLLGDLRIEQSKL